VSERIERCLASMITSYEGTIYGSWWKAEKVLVGVRHARTWRGRSALCQPDALKKKEANLRQSFSIFPW